MKVYFARHGHWWYAEQMLRNRGARRLVSYADSGVNATVEYIREHATTKDEAWKRRERPSNRRPTA
jgi:hypothetical protein